MVGKLFIIAALVGAIAVVANASATGSSYSTPDEAMLAGLAGEGRVIAGPCAKVPRDNEHFGQICYERGSSDETRVIYLVQWIGYADNEQWIGVKPFDGGWTPYDGGKCNIFYCRIATPDDVVLSGRPNGDTNRDGVTDALDALDVLQYDAGLVDRAPTAGYVDNFPGLDSRDALAILQSHAGLIEGLPLRRGEPPFAEK